jgi:hypothetical protein
MREGSADPRLITVKDAFQNATVILERVTGVTALGERADTQFE